MSTYKKAEVERLRFFAHEIRNPLNAMMGYSGILMGDCDSEVMPDQVKDYASRINTATRRLMHVCERVLDEAIEGRLIVRKERVDFTAFCIEMVETFEGDAQAQGVSLTYDIANDFPILQTDPVVLGEIMTNLIGNAIKFTPKGGFVSVKGEVNYKNEVLVLIIQDTGKGIPTTILNSLMKGDRVTTSYVHTNRKGWGQGMQTAQEKVKLLGGNLDIERALSGGTVVYVCLPMAECVLASA